MKKQSWRSRVVVFVFLIVSGLALSQTVEQSHTLNVNGQSGSVKVKEIDGRLYVDMESLARVTNGTVSFSGNQITLTLPNTPSVSGPGQGFSKEFLRAGIEQMAVIREWRSALANSVENNYPIQEDWVEGYRRQASTSLRLASLAASTESDRNAAQLLSAELDNMKALSDKLLVQRKTMHLVSPENLRDNPLNQNILRCARSLASMVVGGQFVDDVSCH